MNKIEAGTKLDFSNVLIRPKRSTLNSRSEVDLNRKFKFKYSNKEINVVPIISENMDSTGTFEVCECLSKHNMITAIHKFYKPEDYKFIDKIGNLYIASNKPFYLIGCEPFKPEEFYKLMYIIYYDENEQTQTEY